MEEFNNSNKVNLYLKKIAINKKWKIKEKNPLVNIFSYTLMPTHPHILFQALGNKEASLFIQKVFGAYTLYFNKKYKRKGSLFCGKAKTIHVDNQAYLSYITYYIHLNILDLINRKWRDGKMILSHKDKKFLFSYPWSSINFYTAKTPNKIIEQNAL